ncbi:hypothetical protein A2U01_0055908, partial [Trifolium medium]|nr:hypothetical protein [Trifolium medium]
NTDGGLNSKNDNVFSRNIVGSMVFEGPSGATGHKVVQFSHGPSPKVWQVHHRGGRKCSKLVGNGKNESYLRNASIRG